ncbi:MAG: ABC transporter permease [Gaiellaceae bacterium]
MTAGLQEPRTLLTDARQELRSLHRYRELLSYMTSTALSTTYSGTFLGYVWWLLDPLMLMVVYVVFVGTILGRGGGGNFGLFVFNSVLVWKFFSSGVRNAIGLTLSKSGLMRQVAFPHSVLPLSSVLAETVHFAVGLAILVAIAVPFGIYPQPALPLVLAVVAIQLMLTLGFAFLLSALNVIFRDVHTLIGHLFQFWFFLSPALYNLSFVPERYRRVYMLNPFATLLPAYHDLLLEHRLPDFGGLAIVAVFSLAMVVGGFLAFVRLQPAFAKVQ